MKRALTSAEEAGWRYTWDGWPVCAACKEKKLSESRCKEWPVPADYNHRGISDDAKCCICRIVFQPKGAPDGPAS